MESSVTNQAKDSSMSSTTDQIIQYAASGVQQIQIARMLGVDDSYVSQVVNDPDNASKIQELAAEISEENRKFDDDIDASEEIALATVKRRLGMANMQQSLVALKTLNSLKRRRDTSPAMRQQTGTVVQLMMPQVTLVNYVANSQAEIVEVEGRTMVSAQSSQLAVLMQQRLGRVPDENNRQMSQVKQERTNEMIEQIRAPRRIRSSSADLDISDII